MLKKLLRALVIGLVIILGAGFITVNAAGIIIFEDDNPDGVTVLANDDEHYLIEVDDTTGIGYVMFVVDEERTTIGTVEVTIVETGKEPEILCNSGNNSLGSLVITIGDNAVITSSTGTISGIFTVNTVVQIVYQQ